MNDYPPKIKLQSKFPKDIPHAYIKGYVEFYKLKFKVTPDVLIPRPETELLVDEVLRFLSQLHTTNYELPTLVLLDLGTGAGNIAISIAKNLILHPKGVKVNIIATDVSAKALKVARQNAKLHGVEDKITFLQSDLLSNVIPANAGIQLIKSRSELDPRLRGDDKLIIVTNLPYIPSARIPYLDSSVKDFEPLVALDGGEDGFELYRKLFQQLKEKNWLARRSLGEGRKLKIFVGEIDYTHGELAGNVAQKYFPKAKVEVKTDLAHKQRILIIKHSTG